MNNLEKIIAADEKLMRKQAAAEQELEALKVEFMAKKSVTAKNKLDNKMTKLEKFLGLK